MDDAADQGLRHELNTALTVLRLRVQMLQRHARFDGSVRQPLGEILASLDDVQAVCGRVLERLGETGHPEIDPGADRGTAEDLGIAEAVSVPHVAVVNDDTTFLRLMHELLGIEEGYKVSTSFVGSEGYLFVKNLQPDLVILDLVFGNSAEEGWRTLDLLTLDPATRKIPVIVCSATTVQLQDHADRLSRLDVRVLTKPFDLEELLGVVREELGNRREATTP